MLTEKEQSLLEEFRKIFPEIDFTEVKSPYHDTENKLLPHISSFTKEQWEAIVASKYNDLFQRGIPHIDWSTDRKELFWRVKKIFDAKIAERKSSGAWYTQRKWFVTTAAGVNLKLTLEEPVVRGHGNYSYIIEVVDEIPELPTHIAYQIEVSEGEVYIAAQFLGTLDECTEWVAGRGKYCRMIKL